MCSCGNANCLSTETISIPNGAAGQNGNNGFFGGFSAEWVFDTATSANPPLTELRFNNATLSSVTKIYINDTNADSVDHNAFLEEFKNNVGGTDYFGLIRVWKQYDSDVFWIGRITAVVDNGADHTITVTHIASNGTFADTDDVVTSFTPQGAAGADGNDGAAGTGGAYVVDAVFTGSVAAGSAVTALGSLSIPADTLDTNEDMLEFSATITRESTNINDDILVMSFGDQGYVLDTGERITNVKFQGHQMRIVGRIVRKDATNVFVEIEAFDSTYTSTGDSLYPSAVVSMAMDTQAFNPAQINLLEIIVATNSSEEVITLQQFNVKFTPRTS